MYLLETPIYFTQHHSIQCVDVPTQQTLVSVPPRLMGMPNRGDEDESSHRDPMGLT